MGEERRRGEEGQAGDGGSNFRIPTLESNFRFYLTSRDHAVDDGEQEHDDGKGDHDDGSFTMVEVGVLSGGGLAMWSDFFGPKVEVTGFDISLAPVWENRRELARRGAFSMLPHDAAGADDKEITICAENVRNATYFTDDRGVLRSLHPNDNFHSFFADGAGRNCALPAASRLPLPVLVGDEEHQGFFSQKGEGPRVETDWTSGVHASRETGPPVLSGEELYRPGPLLFFFNQDEVVWTISERLGAFLDGRKRPLRFVLDDGKHDSTSAWKTFMAFAGPLMRARERTGKPWLYVLEDCACTAFLMALQNRRPDLVVYRFWNGVNSHLTFIMPKDGVPED